jgi:hypothetical protein
MIRNEIEARSRVAKPRKAFQLGVAFCRRMNYRAWRDVLFSGCPLPEDVMSDTRVVVRCNATLGSFSCNASKCSIIRMDEPPCFCAQLQNANIPDTCFRHGHLATTEIAHVLPLCGVEKDTSSFDEVQVVWMQGSKFRGALCKQTAVEKLKSSIDNYIEGLLENLPIIRAMEIRNMTEALLAWKSEVLLRYDRLCDDPRNFRISFKTKKAIIEVNKRFVIAPVDKNPQSLCPSSLGAHEQ